MSDQKPSDTVDRHAAAKESCARIAAEFGNLIRALAPSEDVMHHFRTAQIEVLQGLRTLIDDRIRDLSAERQKGTSVTIE